MHIATCCTCSIYYLLYMMHLLIGDKPGLLSTFFSLVKKRLCSPELKHCLNVYSVVLCTLGNNLINKCEEDQYLIWKCHYFMIKIRYVFKHFLSKIKKFSFYFKSYFSQDGHKLMTCCQVLVLLDILVRCRRTGVF